MTAFARAAFIAVLMLLASVATAVVTPRASVGAVAAPDLDAMLPEEFGVWRRVALADAVLPPESKLGPGEAVAYRAEPSPTATPSPTPTATARPIGPVEPGEYRWDELGGGECLEPYVDAWQDEYTVVDCAEPHGGQLVRRAEFPLAEGALEPGPYPGEEVLAAQMSLLCTAPGVLDLAAAGGLTDVQVQGAFPATEEQWDAGARDYFCFASRSSGEPITGSLAPPAPAA